jgi:hypothetical protein
VSVREFLEGFLLPLVTGGALHVGEPISEEEVAVWEQELGHASDVAEAIDGMRGAIAQELVVSPPPILLGAADLRLGAALHDMLVLLHPRATSWSGRRGRAGILQSAQALADVAAPADRAELLGRHALLHKIFAITREDTSVKWWSGKAQFHGAPPPRRLTRWRDVRRVVETKTTVSLVDLLAKEDARIVLADLVAASPLTDLLCAARPYPPLALPEVAPVLADAELARAAAYRIVDPPDVAALAAIGAAWEQMLDQAVAAPAIVAASTAFLVHLGALLAIAEATPRATATDLDTPSHVVGDLLGAGAPWLAAADAAELADPRLAAPPGIRDDRRYDRRWEAHRAQIRAALGDDVIRRLGERLTGALRRAA